MKKLLVLTDSTSLPRDNPQVVLCEQTWPYLLRDYLTDMKNPYELLQGSAGGATSFDIYNRAAYLKMFSPDVIIVQVGIVDAAPRALTQKEWVVWHYFWITRKICNFILPRYGAKIRKFRQKSNLSESEYRNNLENTNAFFTPSTSIYAISTIVPCQEYEHMNPGIRAKVVRYNAVMREVYGDKYIDISDMPLDALMTDYHHPNVVGHQWILNRIKEYIKF